MTKDIGRREVKGLNRVEEELSRATKDTAPFLIARLKERELTFTNSLRLRRGGPEIYRCLLRQHPMGRGVASVRTRFGGAQGAEWLRLRPGPLGQIEQQNFSL